MDLIVNYPQISVLWLFFPKKKELRETMSYILSKFFYFKNANRKESLFTIFKLQ